MNSRHLIFLEWFYFPVMVSFNLFSIFIDICSVVVSYTVGYSTMAPFIIFDASVVLL